MEVFIIKMAAFLRPLFFIEIEQENFFDLAAIGIFLVLAIAFLSNTALRQSIRITAVDFIIFFFTAWSLICYLIYFEKGNIRELAKLIIPLLTYVVAKNILRDKTQYQAMLGWMIAGFVVPVILSALLIASGKGIEVIGPSKNINYWTGIARWQGVYAGAHNLGHNMVFLFFLMTVYLHVARTASTGGPQPFALGKRVLFLVLGTAALYSLLMSQVRTTILGLLVFLTYYLYVFNKRLLLLGGVTVVVVFAVMLPVIKPFLFPDIVMMEKEGGSIESFGSGRPSIWADNLAYFSALPLDRQLAGIGVGNNEASPQGLDSHNDYLYVLVGTGIVGFLLFVMLQMALLRAILKLEGRDRYVYLSIFAAVFVMSFVSNSYVSRFGLAQMYYLLLAYVEMPKKKEIVSVETRTVESRV